MKLLFALPSLGFVSLRVPQGDALYAMAQAYLDEGVELVRVGEVRV